MKRGTHTEASVVRHLRGPGFLDGAFGDTRARNRERDLIVWTLVGSVVMSMLAWTVSTERRVVACGYS
jgi:hypothetical protein